MGGRTRTCVRARSVRARFEGAQRNRARQIFGHVQRNVSWYRASAHPLACAYSGLTLRYDAFEPRRQPMRRPPLTRTNTPTNPMCPHTHTHKPQARTETSTLPLLRAECRRGMRAEPCVPWCGHCSGGEKKKRKKKDRRDKKEKRRNG